MARVGRFAVGIALLAVTLAHPSATRMHTWPWALLVAVLWLLPLAWCVVQLRAAATWRLPGKLVTAGLALLTLGSVASAWTSPFSAASLARTWPVLGGVTLCLLLHHWLVEPAAAVHTRTWTIARWVARGGAVLVTFSLAGWIQRGWPAPWLNRNAVPFGHSNYTGGLVVLLLPWFVLCAATSRGAARLAWMAANCAALLVLAGTSSRGAVLALVAVGGCATLIAVAFAPWSRRRKLLFALAAIVLALGAFGSNPRLRELALRRTWSEAARESNRQRAAMLDAGRRLGSERPVLGWGPGAVPLAYPRIRAKLDGGVDNVLQLHNTPAQVWACLGFAGVAALGLLTAGAGAAFIRALRLRERAPPALAAAASLGGYGLFSLTDHAFDLPIVALLTGAQLALLTAATAGDGALPLTPLRRLVVGLHLLALVSGPAYALGRELLARHIYEQGVTAWEEGHPADFVAALGRAANLTPHDPFFQHHAANELLQARELMSDASSKRELTLAAVARLQASLHAGVHEEYAHFNLGWLKLELNEPAAAARHFVAAARLVPDKGGVYFGLGLALQAAGNRDAAARAFALEWINDPRSLTSPAWEVPALAAMRSAVQTETLRLYAPLRDEDARVALVERWTRWWLGEPIDAVDLPRGPTDEMAAFAAAGPLIGRRAPLAPTSRWGQLYAAWLQPDSANAFQSLANGDAAFGAALQRRALEHRDDFRAFLSAPIGSEAALVRSFRRQRTGYGVLALHPDGPPLTDVYIVQENRILAEFAVGLFPPKGWLPGRFLLALLPPTPR